MCTYQEAYKAITLKSIYNRVDKYNNDICREYNLHLKDASFPYLMGKALWPFVRIFGILTMKHYGETLCRLNGLLNGQLNHMYISYQIWRF